MADIDWSSIGKRVADAAPLLGTALLGPAGTALGALVASTLGTGGSPAQVLTAINADPSALVKIKELENAEAASIRGHVLAMAQNATDLAKAEMADTHGARIAHKDHWMPSLLTIVLALMVSIMTWGVMTIAVPDSSKEVAFFIVGQIMTAFITAITFWLGSSRGSYDKSRELREKAV